MVTITCLEVIAVRSRLFSLLASVRLAKSFHEKAG
jgi:hypothetical protein